MFVDIPIQSKVHDQQFTLTLDNVTYLLRFRFNFRENYWCMDISTEAGVLIVGGVVLLKGLNLLTRFGNINLPQGQMFVADTGGTSEEMNFDNLNITHFLAYETAA
jgi:hypothetical protein